MITIKLNNLKIYQMKSVAHTKIVKNFYSTSNEDKMVNFNSPVDKYRLSFLYNEILNVFPNEVEVSVQIYTSHIRIYFDDYSFDNFDDYFSRRKRTKEVNNMEMLVCRILKFIFM